MTRREWIAMAAAPAAAQPGGGDRLRLWYRQPAERWIDALPVGNGRLGAMVYGGWQIARIQLNENSLWAGRHHPQDGSKFRTALPQVRQMLFAGDYDGANALASRSLVGEWGKWYGAYQTLGDLVLEFDGNAVEGYERELDLEEGIARVRFRSGGKELSYAVFASAPAQCIVIHVTSAAPVSLRVKLERQACETRFSDRGVEWWGEAPEGGVKWAAAAKAHRPDMGAVKAAGDALLLEKCAAATFLVAAGTSYGGQDPRARLIFPRLPANLPALLYEGHKKDFRTRFQRVSLDLGGKEKNALPTDERVKAVREGAEDPALCALYFQYGRYLLMSSSRPGGLPANLQGLWNHRLDPPWESDYHVNINIPMNYWPAEAANLSECHEPLFKFAERLLPDAQRVARDFYGARGAAMHYTTNVWGYAEPGHQTIFGLWQDGIAWLARHFWERWQFNRDPGFLRLRTWPFLREAALFYCDLLTAHPSTGKLVPGPQASPENTYRSRSGARGWVAMGCTTSVQTVADLFQCVLQAAAELKIEDAFVAEVRRKSRRLPPVAPVGSAGQLLEWPEELEEAEPGHRHVSHLYALHPASLITPQTTPDAAKAARVTLDRRLAAGSGQTGWSAAWMVNFFARLRDADKAHEILYKLLRQSTEFNLFDTHPSGGGPIFQIDGNLGGCAGIGEMLLQSLNGVLDLLPALPSQWRNGSVSGLKARGGYTVSMRWRDALLLEASVTANVAGSCKIQAPRRMAVQSGSGAIGWPIVWKHGAEERLVLIPGA